MKRPRATVLASAVILALSLNFYAIAASNAKDEQALREVDNGIIAAQTTDQIMQYVDKDMVLSDFLPPMEYDGEKAIRAHFDQFFNNATDIKAEFVKVKIITDGKLGIVYSIQHFTWKNKDGKPGDGTFRLTDVFHKVGGQWKDIHTHVSLPPQPPAKG